MSAYGEAFEHLSESILRTPGDLAPELRATIEEYAAGLGADPRSLPPELVPYLEKVTRNASTIVDADVERLKVAGYSDDAIFEATLAAALGAARGRLERGLAALER